MISFSHMIMCSILLTSGMLPIKDIYINNLTENDTNTGETVNTALFTIARGQAMLYARDTLHLANTGNVYREIFEFAKK